MPNPNPKAGRKFEKGNNANPLGAGAHNKDVKRIRRLTNQEVAQLGSMLLEHSQVELMEIRDDRNSSSLQKWFATVIINGIAQADMRTLDALLDRLVGKVKDHLELTGENGGPQKIVYVDLEEVRAMREKIKNDC